MKKTLLTIAAVCLSMTTFADEGMWLLPYLKQMNAADMKARGLKLQTEDIYSATGTSLKDAIVIFGGGCTGEIVSPNGLVFTNHHCGYGAIQQLSTVDHDYLKYGFWADSPAGELPAEGLSVTFIRSIEDVTERILGNVPSISSGKERAALLDANKKALIAELEAANEGMNVIVPGYFGNNLFLAMVMERYEDIRLVGTPPSSIGKFGGETDNWMWPRHTGDFSIFRIYADKDGKPAEYSADNTPLHTEKFLKISNKGYKPGDYAMVMGFPGSTQRYMTSYEIDNMLEVSNPQRIFIRGERQKILKEDMESDDRIRIQYASKYASSSNYWKNSIGMSRGVERLNVKGRKEAQESDFIAWAQTQTLPEEGISQSLDQIKTYVESTRESQASSQYLSEALLRAVEIMQPAMVPFAKIGKAGSYAPFYKDYNPSTDRKVAHRMFEIVKRDVKDLPTVFAEVIDEKFGGDTDAYVDYLYDNSIFASEERLNAFLDNPDEEVYNADPAVVLATSVIRKIMELRSSVGASSSLFADGHRNYIAGLMRKNPEKAWYPDANFTIRLTYGNVLPLSQSKRKRLNRKNYFTTLDGVIAKEDPTNPTEFTVPERLKELYASRDYGRYADKDRKMHVCFLTNLDITGGNSGSPILNGNGELTGLAFDGNWEAMSGDIAFEPELQRCIGVDIRYVLFIIDKFAGASWLLDELEIVE